MKKLYEKDLNELTEFELNQLTVINANLSKIFGKEQKIHQTKARIDFLLKLEEQAMENKELKKECEGDLIGDPSDLKQMEIEVNKLKAAYRKFMDSPENIKINKEKVEKALSKIKDYREDPKKDVLQIGFRAQTRMNKKKGFMEMTGVEVITFVIDSRTPILIK
jgi:DNA repair ATPase RecN